MAILGNIFLCYHIYLIGFQYTTIEYFEKRRSKKSQVSKSPYDVGFYKNFKNTLGNNPLVWLIPIGKTFI